MSITVASELMIEHSGHRLRLRGEANSLAAEFDSFGALRAFRRALPGGRLRLPGSLRLPGMDSISVEVLVRGRVVAFMNTQDFLVSVRFRWLALLATFLRLPVRG